MVRTGGGVVGAGFLDQTKAVHFSISFFFYYWPPFCGWQSAIGCISFFLFDFVVDRGFFVFFSFVGSLFFFAPVALKCGPFGGANWIDSVLPDHRAMGLGLVLAYGRDQTKVDQCRLLVS